MARIHPVVLGMLILQMYVHAAPSDISKLEDIATVEKADSTNQEIKPEESKNDNTNQGARQKRYFNYYGYGFPPMNPLIYPNYDRRDSTGAYGFEDPLANIHRRLQEIANVVRQPTPPPPLHFPLLFPVIFIPQAGCQCFPETTTSPPQTPPQIPPQTPPADQNQTNPDVVNRFPEMDDERQNWGLVINETEYDEYDESDGSRPISFEPIAINRTMTKPPPPVEHGTVQSNAQAPVTTTTTRSIANPGFNVMSGFAAPASPQAPSTCDGAVLTCCHQLTVTYDCFAVQGCPDPTSYGNPCDPDVILKVIDRFQQYYGRKD